MKKYCYSVTGNQVWFEAAKNLYDNNVAKPVIWLGDDVHFAKATEYFGDDVVLKMLDFVHYQHNISNFEYSSEHFSFFSSLNYSRAKDRCLKMIDRLDLYGVYSRIDREAVFNKLVIFYLQKIKKAKPDALIVAEAPHSHAQYLMYEICLFLGIKVAKFNTWMPVPLLYLQDITTGERQKRRSPLNPEISSIMKQRLESYFNDLLDASKNELYEVDYMQKQRIANRWNVKFKRLITSGLKSSIREALSQLKRNFDGNYYPVNPYKLGFFTRQKIKTMRKKNLFKQFLINVDQIDVLNKFVYFALHYEPERTTNPDGDEYHDQFFAILELRNFLPKDVDIIVKEHPSQFFMSDRGSRGRSPIFYELLKKVKGVQLADVNQNSIALINRSDFVATISGTVALEAALVGKKAIIFGDSWFNHCPNIINWSADINYNHMLKISVKPVSDVVRYIYSLKDLYAVPGFQNNSCEKRWSEFDTKKFRAEELTGVYYLMRDYLIQK